MAVPGVLPQLNAENAKKTPRRLLKVLLFIFLAFCNFHVSIFNCYVRRAKLVLWSGYGQANTDGGWLSACYEDSLLLLDAAHLCVGRASLLMLLFQLFVVAALAKCGRSTPLAILDLVL